MVRDSIQIETAKICLFSDVCTTIVDNVYRCNVSVFFFLFFSAIIFKSFILMHTVALTHCWHQHSMNHIPKVYKCSREAIKYNRFCLNISYLITNNDSFPLIRR